MADAAPTTPRDPSRLDASRHPVAYALLLATSYIGISWLMAPALTRLGLPGDVSRPHQIFIAAIFSAIMTVVARRDAAASRPTG